MKKIIAVLFALGSAAVFAGMNDLLISFSTPGPDKYADGSVVLDGERYALVWTSNDGATQKQVIVVPAAKDGKCVPVLFTIREENVSKYEGGTWGVYLLDTRDFTKDATGKTLAGTDASGKPTVVNVTASVANGMANAKGMATADATAGVSAGAYDLAAANVPVPKVTGIQVVGADVVVTVQDTVPFVGYTLKTGTNATAITVPAGAAANGDYSGEIKLVAPKTEGAQFFKVSTIK